MIAVYDERLSDQLLGLHGLYEPKGPVPRQHRPRQRRSSPTAAAAAPGVRSPRAVHRAPAPALGFNRPAAAAAAHP